MAYQAYFTENPSVLDARNYFKTQLQKQKDIVFEQNGIHGISKKVKAYCRAIWGNTSQAFRNVSSIEFVKSTY